MNEDIINNILKIDSQFNEEVFTLWVQDIFKDIQKAWSKKDYQVLEFYETNRLFQEHKNQLTNMDLRKINNYVENINIKDLSIIDCEVEEKYVRIIVGVEVSLIDYYQNKKGEIVSGSAEKTRNVQYHLVFIKEEDNQDMDLRTIKNLACPYCGAPIQLDKINYCEYCQKDLPKFQNSYQLDDLEIVQNSIET